MDGVAGHERLRRLAAALLPGEDVSGADDVAAVALSWVSGTPSPPGSGDPGRLRDLLEALAGIDVGAGSPVGRHLDQPHAYAGREDWAGLMRYVVAQLPDDVCDEGAARLEAAMALSAVAPVLVHGDLAGDDVRWHPDGSLAAVIDWDLASAFDPAVDAACLAWFGWDAVAGAVEPDVLERARVWEATSHLESVAAAIDGGEVVVVVVVERRLAAAATHLREGRPRVVRSGARR